MNVHDSMLFRWAGYDIEEPRQKHLPVPRRKVLTASPKLTDQQIGQYLNYLRDALNPERGLRVSDYNPDDQVGKHKPLAEPRPCLFFTEQAAGDAEGHWRHYGRLGFGFAKGFIFGLGGRPVIYSGGSKDPVLKSVNSIRNILAGQYEEGHRIRRDFETLVRFIKLTSMPKREPQEPGPAVPKGKAAAKAAAKGVMAKTMLEQCEFPEHKPIRFLREREWRLIEPEAHTKRWHRDAEGHLWFAPEAGRELELIILPCNLLLQQVCNDPFIQKRLTGPTGIMAQPLSVQALRKL